VVHSQVLVELLGPLVAVLLALVVRLQVLQVQQPKQLVVLQFGPEVVRLVEVS
jgi:hypothetical protein